MDGYCDRTNVRGHLGTVFWVDREPSMAREVVEMWIDKLAALTGVWDIAQDWFNEQVYKVPRTLRVFLVQSGTRKKDQKREKKEWK